MTPRFLLFPVLALTFYSCTTKNQKRVTLDDVIAEGNISKDTVYNGIIKFYDKASNKLVTSVNYKEGMMHGEAKFFDSSGNVSDKQSFYYGLRVGPSIEYKKGQISQYYFYSLENKELLHINYDSIQGKRIDQLNDTSFFFWHLSDYSAYKSQDRRTELFVYLPNPPKLNFKYSLCIIDNAYHIKTVVKEFVPIANWDVISIDYPNLKTGEIYAIKLSVDDEFDNDNRIATMFKKL